MYNRRYFLGFTIALFILIADQVYIQYQISGSDADASIINIAGRQRMYSQRISLEFFKHATGYSHSPKMLQRLHNKWLEGHTMLIRAPLVQSAVSYYGEEAILPFLAQKIEYTRTYLDAEADVLAANIVPVEDSLRQFLYEMDNLVNILEAYAQIKISHLKTIQFGLFCLSVFILILELFFVFKPIERSLNQNIHSVQQKNQDLQQMSQKLRERNKKIYSLSFSIAHDLKEPLRTICTHAQILKEDHYEQLDPHIRASLDYLEDASLRMTDQINGLMHYAQRGQHSKIEWTNCSQMLGNVLADLDHAITESGASITTGTLPFIHAYPKELHLLFQNVLSNAIKYRREGVAPQIHIEYQMLYGQHQFAISDNGIGIPSQDREKIFQVFERAHQDGGYAGTGIGLAHCKRIVELHEGKIWTVPNTPCGSTFYFTLSASL